MRLLGFNFIQISCERKKPLQGELKINSNIIIDKIEEEDLDIMKGKLVLKFQFTFSITYSQSAKVEFKGFVLANVEKQEKSEILKTWKKKKIPEQFRIPLFNMILNRCNVKALNLEEDLSLPPHIPLPNIVSGQNSKTNYTG